MSHQNMFIKDNKPITRQVKFILSHIWFIEMLYKSQAQCAVLWKLNILFLVEYLANINMFLIASSTKPQHKLGLTYVVKYKDNKVYIYA